MAGQASSLVLFAARGTPSPLFGPLENEGAERREALPSLFVSIRATRLAKRAGASSALHERRFQSPGPRFPGRGIPASPSPASSSRRGPSAPRRQVYAVCASSTAMRVPRPPKCGVTSPARRRRVPLRRPDVPRRRPSLSEMNKIIIKIGF
jgi:hypothetical protein